MPTAVETVAVGATQKEVEAPVVEESSTPRKTVTNWNSLYETKLFPTMIKCEGYFPMQGFGVGCHTTLLPKADNLAAHLDGDHGGGYWISFRQNVQNDPLGARDIKIAYWDGWKRFEELGVELRDLRCDVCNEEIPVNSRSIIRHCKPHAGKSTRVRPGGDFRITLAREIPVESLEE